MTERKALYVKEECKFAKLAYSTISGTVKKNTVGVRRLIQIYKELNPISIGFTFSSPIDGSWSFNICAGPFTRIRVICLGNADYNEDSEIFDFVHI